MLFSRYFKSTGSLDENLERNLLFSSTYLLKEYEVDEGKQLVFGGHSVLTIEQTDHKATGLYFLRTRTSRSNKLEVKGCAGLLLGFQTRDGQYFLIAGTRGKAARARRGDELLLSFQDGSKLQFEMHPGNTKDSDNNKAYSCNFKMPLSTTDIDLLTDKNLERFELLSSEGGQKASGKFSMEYPRKFREVAQTYKFCLNRYF